MNTKRIGVSFIVTGLFIAFVIVLLVISAILNRKYYVSEGQAVVIDIPNIVSVTGLVSRCRGDTADIVVVGSYGFPYMVKDVNVRLLKKINVTPPVENNTR